jgi:hypothetical protein
MSDNLLHWRQTPSGYLCYVYNSAIPNIEITQWLHRNTTGYYACKCYEQGGDPVLEILIEEETDAMMFKLHFK